MTTYDDALTNIQALEAERVAAAQRADDAAQIAATLADERDAAVERAEANGYLALAAQKKYDEHMATPHYPAPTSAKTSMLAVRVFPSYATKVYGNHAAILDRLGQLGTKRMSHKLTPLIANNAAVIKFTQDAYRLHGIKSWLTIGEPRVPLSPGDWDKMMAVITGPLAGMVERVYGWNEPNWIRDKGHAPAGWETTTAAHQAELWKRMQGTGIKVGTPQLWSGDLAIHDADAAKVGPLIRGNFDHIGWHLYPRSGGAENAKNIDRFAAVYKAALGGTFPVICTEAGYLDAANYTGNAKNFTPAQKAVLVPELAQEYIKRGWGLGYFELCDDPDATESNREASLGLVECQGLDPSTWTNKPAFDTFRDYLAT